MINQKRYFELVQRHPELFTNPSADGITIELDPEKIQQIEQEVKQRLSEQGLPAEWGNVGIAYEDQYILLLRDAVYFGNGKPGTYIRSIQEASVPGVIILPVYQDRIVLTHHFRHATRSWHLEIPRGFGLPTMSSEENARRELYEEIGSSTATLHYLGRAHADTGMSTDCNEFFSPTSRTMVKLIASRVSINSNWLLYQSLSVFSAKVVSLIASPSLRMLVRSYIT